MKYFIDNKIGEPGGFGDVYDCHSELGDRYAIKMLKTDDENAVLRFQKEVRLTSRLNHPNVIRIIACDTEGENKYYIMPKYQCSIVQIIPMLYNNFDRQYNVITEILNGLIYLHEQGVLHRDLKPQNILYNSDTDIAISDLGFSRQIDSDSLRLTQYGDVFGTQRYISPEQAQNSENVDDKTDIFAFGKILEDIVTNFLQYPIPNDEIGYIIDKCTNPHANRRFASSRELKSMVDNVYQNMLKITANDDISTSISLLEIEELDDKIRKSFRNCSRLYNKSTIIGMNESSLQIALLVASVESLAKTEGISFSQFVQKYCETAKKCDIDDMYEIRSKLFHSGEFSFLEFEISMNPYLNPVYEYLSDKYDEYRKIVRKALISWIKHNILTK